MVKRKSYDIPERPATSPPPDGPRPAGPAYGPGPGVAAGLSFAAVGVLFVLISLFTEISRPVWEALSIVKSVLGFSICAAMGWLMGLRDAPWTRAALNGLLAGGIAGVFVPVSIYVLTYAWIDQVQQYPFEHYSMQSSGSRTAREFLESSRGRQIVTETTLELAPVVATWTGLQAALLAGAAAEAGRRWRRRKRIDQLTTPRNRSISDMR